MCGLVETRVEHELGHALAIAEVDEHAPRRVAVGLDPAGQDDLLADIGGAQRAAAVSPVCVARNVLIGARTIA